MGTETFKQTYTQDVNIDLQQNIDDNSYGCNCSCNLITPKDIMDSIAWIFKKIVDLFKCGSKNDGNDSNVIANTVKYLI